MIESRDGGRSFSRPPVPSSVLASLPYEYKPGMRRGGISVPKAVGNPEDGKVYVFATYVDRNRDVRVGQCLFRGAGNSVAGWEMWDGSGSIQGTGPSRSKAQCDVRPRSARPTADRLAARKVLG